MLLEYLGINESCKIYRNLPVPRLVEFALKRGEGVLSDTGALVVQTGKYTGRSPKDRFIVEQGNTRDNINWGEVNIPIKESTYDNLYNQVINYLKGKDLFVFDGYVGAINEYRLPVRVVCQHASQALFANQLFRRFSDDEIKSYNPEFTIISAPGFKGKPSGGINSEAFIIINFDKKIILIGGSQYSGEIKKSVFSVMNFILPMKGVLPMHCSANMGVDGDTAVFFGLSGTGKTTLSADLNRRLIGDDEHGWCDEGIFNFEGGCYAKTIKLDLHKEREIFNAIKFGTLLENVILDLNRKPNYYNGDLTENTRAAYPIEYIENAKLDGIGGTPNNIIFLTADAFGVIPPVSKLSKEAAMYHFMSGYTSKLAGTERGITEPQATFSACFGEPFMLMDPYIYAKMLGEKIERYDTDVYLVNTGWLFGGYDKGHRIELKHTRSMVDAILDGKLKDVKYYNHPVFNVMVPSECPNISSDLLNPKNTWDDKKEYDRVANELAVSFKENFKKFKDVPKIIKDVGP